jgi:hypothetical protein
VKKKLKEKYKIKKKIIQEKAKARVKYALMTGV